MPHPQPRMSPQLAVGARAAPVLNQEHPQPLLRPGQVRLRVERSQFGIGSHPGVEPGDQKPKRLRAADGVIEADSRLFAHGPHPASRRPRTSYSRRQVQAGAGREEGQRIDRKLDRARHRPGAVPHVDLAAQQHRPLAGGGVLQRRAHLAGVQRVDPGVGVEHGEQHRRIVGAVDDVVVRRVAQQPTELGRVGCAAVLVAPGLAEPEALVAHHVEQGRRADHGGEQLRSLGQRGADQQAAVAAAGEAQLGWCSPALCDQPLGRAGEVGEHVALVLPHPGAVPLLALLRAAAQVGDRVDAAGLDPGQEAGGVRRGHGDVKAAVPVQHGGPRRIRCLRRREHEHPDLGAIGTAVAHLARPHRRHVNHPGRRCPDRHLPGAGVVAVHSRRGDVVGVAEPHLRASFRPRGQAGEGAQAGQLDRAARGPGPQVVHRQLSHRMAGVRGRQQRFGQIVVVEQREGIQHGVRLLGHQVDPVLVRRGLRRGDAQPAAHTRHAVAELAVYDLRTGAARGPIELPGLGSLTGLTARPEGGAEVWFGYTDHVTPPRVHRYDARTGQVSVWATPPGVVNMPAVRARQVSYRSADGTEVRMFVLSAAQAPDAPRPTVLHGYGGFNIAMTPTYAASILAWVEAGGVYAIANLRGGSEEGEQWHRAGMREHKGNVFADFAGAAEWLVAQGWTTPAQLSLSGGSNGGLLVGAALTQRPELFAAVVCSAPLLDMVRYERFGLGQTWSDEYGSAADPTELGWLLSYSPYHHVVDGTDYPAVLFTVFDADTRVDPLHARKMCAACN